MGKVRRISSLIQVSSKLDQTNSSAQSLEAGLDPALLSKHVQKYFPKFRKRVFNPVSTLFALLSQVLSADKSCTETVARVNASRVASGESKISPDNSAYCKARDRLPEDFIHSLLVCTGVANESSTLEKWLWKSRKVKVVDGAIITLADTTANQKEYPQHGLQKPGTGFPMMRMMAVFSLATGCVLDLATGPFKGKGSSEHALLRSILHCFEKGDIVLGDAYFPSYFLIATLQALGADCLFASPNKRKKNPKMEKRIFKNDFLITWQKPRNPAWMSKEIYENMPESIQIRECNVTIEKPGFRTSTKTFITTLLDPKYASQAELAALYRLRWHAELNLRSLKTVLKMEHIRSKTPSMARKEIWATLLGYNLIRTLIGASAARYDQPPNTISFKGALQHLNAFNAIALLSKTDKSKHINILIDLISELRVGKRPNRVEPRARKKRPKPFPSLHQPRKEARERVLAGLMR